MRLPYQIQRTRVVDHGDGAEYRFDLVNEANDRVLAMAYSRSPIPPKRLRQRQAELNSNHYFAEYAGEFFGRKA